MIGNTLIFFKRFFYGAFNKIQLKRKKVRWGKKLRINGLIRLYGRGEVLVGDNVKINSCESSNPIGGMTHCVLSVASNARLTIGNNVGISNAAIVCHKSITIEDNVLIGGSVKIYDTDFHSLNYQLRGKGKKDIGNSKDVVIKKDAFIGAHTIILKGVTIGERAIIGAGSVVTRDVGNDEIWAGNPIRKIRGKF